MLLHKPYQRRNVYVVTKTQVLQLDVTRSARYCEIGVHR